MTGNKPNFQEVEGVKIPPFFSKECFESALHFKPKAGDIFIATYPKCGTTWMQNVVLNILRRGKPLNNPRDFFLASPFLEQLGAEDSEKMMIRPGAYKTHLSFDKVPWSDDAKYIYVARNPKDCCVSFYHHMRQIPGYQFSKGTFKEFFNLFITGDLEFNDYFTHLLSWYEQRDRQNVFFTTYEEMKRNLETVILKVAQFIGTDEVSYLRENPKILKQITDNCSFDNMKFINNCINNMYNKIEDILVDPTIPRGRKHIAAYVSKLPRDQEVCIEFIRNGNIGSWKTTFTADQNIKMNSRIYEISQFSNVMTLWKDVL